VFVNFVEQEKEMVETMTEMKRLKWRLVN